MLDSILLLLLCFISGAHENFAKARGAARNTQLRGRTDDVLSRRFFLGRKSSPDSPRVWMIHSPHGRFCQPNWRRRMRFHRWVQNVSGVVYPSHIEAASLPKKRVHKLMIIFILFDVFNRYRIVHKMRRHYLHAVQSVGLPNIACSPVLGKISPRALRRKRVFPAHTKDSFSHAFFWLHFGWSWRDTSGHSCIHHLGLGLRRFGAAEFDCRIIWVVVSRRGNYLLSRIKSRKQAWGFEDSSRT